MFGTNQLRKKEHGDGFTLEVKEIFSTIQGEGPYAGLPAIFVRLAGCHLRCHFCDTDFENGQSMELDRQIVAAIESAALTAKAVKTPLVVITGGEPMRQNILPLCYALVDYGYHIQIETSGTFWVEGLETLIRLGHITLVCSPKTGQVHEQVEEYCDHWKYLIQEGEVSPLDGLPNTSTQVEGMKQNMFRPKDFLLNPCLTIWVQPCEAYRTDNKYYKDVKQTERNTKLAAEIAMRYNYRLSIQTHKIVGLP